MSEQNTQGIAQKTGLELLSEKMDTVLATAQQAVDAAKSAEEKADKTQDELTALKNTPSVAFVPAGAAKPSEEKSAKIKSFLRDVKAAKNGFTVKAPLASGTTPGSYLVPEGFVPEVIDLLAQYPAFINGARRLPWGTNGNTRKIPNLVSRPTVSTVGEGESKPVSNPVFDQLAQELVKGAAIVLLTDDLAEDSAIDLAALLPTLIGPSFVDYYNNWLFNGNGDEHAGILTASGVLSPDVKGIADLLALKLAVPVQVRASGKFYLDTALYGELAALARNAAPAWLYYENGKMQIDGSDVVSVESSLIGARKAVFGDMANIIFSPRKELTVKYTDVATIVEGSTTHHLFQENKEAYLFEVRSDLTVVGNVWAKADVPAGA